MLPHSQNTPYIILTPYMRWHVTTHSKHPPHECEGPHSILPRNQTASTLMQGHTLHISCRTPHTQTPHATIWHPIHHVTTHWSTSSPIWHPTLPYYYTLQWDTLHCHTTTHSNETPYIPMLLHTPMRHPTLPCYCTLQSDTLHSHTTTHSNETPYIAMLLHTPNTWHANLTSCNLCHPILYTPNAPNGHPILHLTTHSKTPNMILHLTTHSNTPNMNLAPYIPYDHTLEHLAHETDILHVSYILRDHSFTSPWYNSWAKAIHQKTSPLEKYRQLFEKYCCKCSRPHPLPCPESCHA